MPGSIDPHIGCEPAPHCILGYRPQIDKMQQIAGAAGIALGGVIYISETTPSLPTPAPAMRMEAAAIAATPPTEILSGESEVTVRVQMVYSIK